MPQFDKQTLIQGKKLYESGKVVQITLNGNQFNARVIDDKNYVVTFTITKNHKISRKICSCHKDFCVHQAAAAYAFNAHNHVAQEQAKKSKPIAKKKPTQVVESKPLSLDEYFSSIKETSKRERDIHKLFMIELDQRLNDAAKQKDAAKNVIQLADEFSRIGYYPKNYRSRIINRFKQSFELLLEDEKNYKEIFNWLLNNRIRLRYKEFDEYFKVSMNYVDIHFIYDQVYFLLFNNDLTNNPYLQELLELYFHCVQALHMDLAQALTDIVKYKNQIIYKYYEIKNLISQDRIEEATKYYNRITQKNHPYMIKIKEELDSYTISLEDEMDDTLRAISKKRNLKDIKALIAQFKKKCGKEWVKYKEPFLNQLSQATTDNHYVSILSQEKEWYLAAKKILNMEDLDAFDKYSTILWDNNKEVYYVLFMHCMESEIKNINGHYDFVVEYLRNLILYQDVDKNIVVSMIYDLQQQFPTRKALIRTLNEFLDGGFVE